MEHLKLSTRQTQQLQADTRDQDQATPPESLPQAGALAIQDDYLADPASGTESRAPAGATPETTLVLVPTEPSASNLRGGVTDDATRHRGPGLRSQSGLQPGPGA